MSCALFRSNSAHAPTFRKVTSSMPVSSVVFVKRIVTFSPRHSSSTPSTWIECSTSVALPAANPTPSTPSRRYATEYTLEKVYTSSDDVSVIEKSLPTVAVTRRRWKSLSVNSSARRPAGVIDTSGFSSSGDW